MMRSPSSFLRVPAMILALLGLCLSAGAASAQVPFDMSYQGRLTDAVGAPLIGPVNLQMRIYDVISGGSPLYIEDHTAVVVDDVGAFSLRLGAGSSLLGTFNTALFAGVNRYLEVVVDGAALTPRLIIGSVPYAMHADNAASAQAAADAAQTTADANTAGVSANTSSISTNATAISDETARAIAADAVHDTAISTNATAISANTAADAIHDADIATNAAAITGEAADLAAADAIHDADIAAHATALAALEARIAALEPGPCTRFCACSDGVTVEDNATGLLWERKTGTGGVHAVTNTYTWSSTGTAADGTAYTVFLADLNTSPGFAGQTDWRLPIISELQSIMLGPGVETFANADPADPNSGLNWTGQATTCAGSPCIDPGFAAVGGPTAASSYWSASGFVYQGVPDPVFAWNAFFSSGFVSGFNFQGAGKTFDSFVRAVRAGSCSS